MKRCLEALSGYRGVAESRLVPSRWAHPIIARRNYPVAWAKKHYSASVYRFRSIDGPWTSLSTNAEGRKGNEVVRVSVNVAPSIFESYHIGGNPYPSYIAHSKAEGGPAHPDFSGMEVVFLGTGAGSPGPNRGSSSVAVRMEKHTVLIDCGEGTQVQLQRCSRISITALRNILITHMHGDHVLGLLGVILTCQRSIYQERESMEAAACERGLKIYGPPGLYSFLVNSVLSTESQLIVPIDIIELHSRSSQATEEAPSQSYQLISHHILRPSSPEGTTQVWEMELEDDLRVQATRIHHVVTTFGYVLQEKDIPGKLDVEAAKRRGLHPGPNYARLKKGESVQLPSGEWVHPQEVTGKPHKGRKVVVLGDTYDASSSVPLSLDADLVIHEATLPNSQPRRAQVSQHATANIAADFARKVRTKHLVLTHFGARFDSTRDLLGADLLQAHQTLGPNVCVYAAADFLCIQLPRGGVARDGEDHQGDETKGEAQE